MIIVLERLTEGINNKIHVCRLELRLLPHDDCLDEYRVSKKYYSQVMLG